MTTQPHSEVEPRAGDRDHDHEHVEEKTTSEVEPNTSPFDIVFNHNFCLLFECRVQDGKTTSTIMIADLDGRREVKGSELDSDLLEDFQSLFHLIEDILLDESTRSRS